MNRNQEIDHSQYIFSPTGVPGDTSEISSKHPSQKIQWKRDFCDNAYVVRRPMSCFIRKSFLQQLSKEKMEILQRIRDVGCNFSQTFKVSNHSPHLQQISLGIHVSRHLQGDLVSQFSFDINLSRGEHVCALLCWWVSPIHTEKVSNILFKLRKS